MTTTLASQPLVKIPSRLQASVPLPAANTLSIFTDEVCNIATPCWKTEDGVIRIMQDAIYDTNIHAFIGGATGTVGTGTAIGGTFSSNGTVTHPSLTTTLAGQTSRTRYANVVTTQNQVLGALGLVPAKFWRGNAAGLGGFFFHSKFIVELIPASTIRIFSGLSSGSSSVITTDAQVGDCVALYHDTTDPLSGSGALNIITRDNVTSTKTALTLGTGLAAGQMYEVWLYCPPNSSTIYYKVVQTTNSTVVTIADSSTSTTLPRNTIFMQPQTSMSNGTANIVVTTTAIGVSMIYARQLT